MRAAGRVQGFCAAAAAAMLAAGLTLAGEAAAQSKVTRMVIGFPAGGPIDIVGRLIAEPMARELGNPVIIDNKPGGGTIIASQAVAASPGDGSVIYLSSMSTFVLNPLLHEKLPYSVEKDFVPVSLVVASPPVLVVHPSNPAADAAEFAAAAERPKARSRSARPVPAAPPTSRSRPLRKRRAPSSCTCPTRARPPSSTTYSATR